MKKSREVKDKCYWVGKIRVIQGKDVVKSWEDKTGDQEEDEDLSNSPGGTNRKEKEM